MNQLIKTIRLIYGVHVRGVINLKLPLVQVFRNGYQDRKVKKKGLFFIDELSDYSGFEKLKQKCFDDSITYYNEILSSTQNSNSYKVRNRNIIEVFDDLSNCLCLVADLSEFIRNVHPNSRFREAATATILDIGYFIERLNTDVQLYETLRMFVENGDQFQINQYDQFISQLFLHDFEISGVHLPKNQREQIVDLTNAIMKLNQQFANFENNFEENFSKLPVHLRESYSNELSMSNQDLSLHDNKIVRETHYILLNMYNKVLDDLLHDLLKKRYQLARLCGYNSFADRALCNSAASTPSFVTDFLNRFVRKLEPFHQFDMDLLGRFADTKSNQSNYNKIAVYDISYHAMKLRHQFLGIQDHELQEYFTLKNCLGAFNQLVEEIFQISLLECDLSSEDCWSNDVLKLQVHHHTEGYLGDVYCDFFERPGKLNQDCHFTVRGYKEFYNRLPNQIFTRNRFHSKNFSIMLLKDIVEILIFTSTLLKFTTQYGVIFSCKKDMCYYVRHSLKDETVFGNSITNTTRMIISDYFIDFHKYSGGKLKIFQNPDYIIFYNCPNHKSVSFFQKFNWNPLSENLKKRYNDRYGQVLLYAENIVFQKCLEDYCDIFRNNNSLNTSKFICENRKIRYFNFKLSQKVTTLCLDSITVAILNSSNLVDLNTTPLFNYTTNLVLLTIVAPINIKPIKCDLFQGIVDLRLLNLLNVKLISAYCFFDFNPQLIRISNSSARLWNMCNNSFDLVNDVDFENNVDSEKNNTFIYYSFLQIFFILFLIGLALWSIHFILEKKFTDRRNRIFSTLIEPISTPIVVIVLNLKRDNIKNNGTILLTPQNVENLFHEMGHALASMFGRTKYQHVSGTRCSTDLAEVPSILMEYFAFHPKVLKCYVKHYKTLEPIPNDLIDKLLVSRNLLYAHELKSQSFYAMLDICFHDNYDGNNLHLLDIYRRYHQHFYGFEHVPDTAWYLHFNHLVTYGSKYYSYLFSRAIASLIWLRKFSDQQCWSSNGEQYRRHFLAHGGGKPPKQLISDYLGLLITPDNISEALICDLKPRYKLLEQYFK